MKITFNWLKERVGFDGTPEAMAERLTQLGMEVERLDRVGQSFSGVVVAQVLSRDRHPNADKLSVCRVADGTGERQIVCGAQNFQAGDKVPLILPGNPLPPKPGDKEPFVIKVGKIRGVESHGMLCAADELGLDPEALGLKREEGLLILPSDAAVGQAFGEFLGQGGPDVVFDLEITPNRPDWNGALGIARDLSAVLGTTVKTDPDTWVDASGEATALVRVEAPDACPCYTARRLRGVRVGPSPAWLRDLLEKVGFRSINNVVDITNYVMWELGQPLHAFDAARLEKGASGQPEIVVRRATDGERLRLLDGREVTLGPNDLLIASPSGPLALAGVMGGQSSEVGEATTELLLESATFEPTALRRTAKRLGLRTEASYRFERGTDPNGADQASRRAAALLQAWAGGEAWGPAVLVRAQEWEPRSVTLRYSRVNALLGLKLAPEEVDGYLAALGIRVAVRRPRPLDASGDRGEESETYVIPSDRLDVKGEIDLIEEVARLHGVDRIPSVPPRQARGSHAFDSRYDELMQVRELMAGLGLDEVQGQTLISGAGVGGGWAEQTVALANPLSQDMDVLRPSLLPGLLDVLGHNARQGNRDVAVFELGRVFRKSGTGVGEGWRLAVALTGRRQPPFWSGADREALWEGMDAKGLLEELLERLGVGGVSWARRTEPNEWWVESAEVRLGNKRVLGELGQVQPRWARKREVRDPVWMAEIEIESLLGRQAGGRTGKPLPAFPAVRRDVALVVGEAVTHEAVMQVVRQAKVAHLESVLLFDVFRGGHVAEGQKSVAYAMTYRGTDRTLTDAEVSQAHERLVQALESALGAAARR